MSTSLSRIRETVSESFPDGKVTITNLGQKDYYQVWVDFAADTPSRFATFRLDEVEDETEFLQNLVDILTA